MKARAAAALTMMLAAPGPALADQPSLKGLALGMTSKQAIESTPLPCTKPPYTSELDCRDDSDGSNYKVIFSAGDPSVALSIQRSFCSHDPKQEILDKALQAFKVGADRAHRDPNGYHVDLDGNNEAILNADDGTCPANGGTHYLFLIRGNTLINSSDKQAVDRAKAAMH